MKEERNHYLIRLQFLGFRYSGWQKQPNERTIEGMLSKTMKFILPNREFKILGSGRTDAKVSALDMAFELFLKGTPIANTVDFLMILNKNLPPDIRALDISEVDAKFNIIQDSKIKEYVYLFSFGEKNHPFCAPFMANVIAELDLEAMKSAAKLLEGTHNFSAYTAGRQKNTKVIRTVTRCHISENSILEASFFPVKSYMLTVCGEGFMRYQIRMMMGALIQLGRGTLSIEDIQRSLIPDLNMKLEFIAPASGLLLNKLDFK